MSAAFDVEAEPRPGRPPTSSAVCRVSVQSGNVQVDLALPVAVPVALLIPCLVDVIDEHAGPCALTARGDAIPRNWQLSRPGGPPLKPATTLSDNGLRDGELLLLARAGTVAPGPVFDDVFSAVANPQSLTAPEWTPRAARITGAVAALWAAGLGALVLLRSGIGAAGPGHVVAAAIAASAAGLAAAIAGRVYRDRLAGLTMSVVATGFAAVGGFLAVPAGPGGPNLMLGSAAGAAASIVILRVTRGGTICLTAIATFALTACVAASANVAWGAPVGTVGAALGAASVGLLILAPRLTISMARLSPSVPVAADPGDDHPDTAEHINAKAAGAHATLTGLVGGLSASAALGAALVILTVGYHGGNLFSGAVFAAVIAAVLMLRSRSHTDLAQTVTLVIGGIVSLTAAFVAVSAAAPQLADWLCALAGIAAAAALFLGFAASSAAFTPIARRSVELIECLSLAAVLPLACWVCGLYGVVRGLPVP